MSDWPVILTSGFAGILAAKIIEYLTARLSARSRGEQIADLSQKYLTLADMTVDQLEERINLIGKLDAKIGELKSQNRSLHYELEELKARRAQRDEQIEAMESGMAALQQQVNKDSSERAELREKLARFEAKYRAMWQYLLALLEQMKRHSVTPPDPPKELESDPDIMRIVKEIKKGRQ